MTVKENMKKLSDKMKLIFGYGIMIALFAGGMTFFGYVAALILGGAAAVIICDVLYQKIIPMIVYITSFLVLFGLVSMYLAGEKTLTPSNKYKERKK